MNVNDRIRLIRRAAVDEGWERYDNVLLLCDDAEALLKERHQLQEERSKLQKDLEWQKGWSAESWKRVQDLRQFLGELDDALRRKMREHA